MKKSKYCEWTKDESANTFYYDTTCDKHFLSGILNLEYLKINCIEFKFCPFCGKIIKYIEEKK